MVEQAKDKVVLVLSTSQETKLMITQEFELEVVVAVSDENGGTFSQTVRHRLQMPPIPCCCPDRLELLAYL